MGESVQPPRLQPLQPRGRERLARHLERELGQDEHPEGAPRDVHALPERIRAEQDARARLPKTTQQVIALSLPLDEERPATRDRVPHRVRRPLERRVAREQHEHAAVRRMSQFDEHPRHRSAVTRFVVAWLWKVGGNPEQALLGEIERRGVNLAHLHPARGQVESEPLLEVAEVAPRGERGARQHHRLDPVEQVLFEYRRQVEWHGGEREVDGLPPPPLEPADRGGPSQRRPESRRQPCRCRIEASDHAAQLTQQLRTPLRGVVERQPIGDHRRSLGEA